MLLRADSRRFPLTNQLKDFADCTPALLEARQEESVRLIVEYWGIRYDKDARDLTKQNVDELSKTSPRPSHSSRRVTIRQVIDAGLLVPGERLVWDRPRKGERWFATVTENGRLRLDDGSEYPTPTAAARAAAGDVAAAVWTCGSARATVRSSATSGSSSVYRRSRLRWPAHHWWLPSVREANRSFIPVPPRFQPVFCNIREND